ncbi:uncharacterized protein LOC143782126 [Ranitomeya variabilis]|uniref:uncharacterized protein LOC143782126 n=1 Tax=Ranitomeya variabilis TaxID=490064 RepID=UPI004055EDFB
MTQEKPRSSKSKTPTLVSDSDSDQPILSDASLSSCPASSSSSEIEGRSCFPLDSVDNLVKSIRNTMGCEESKGAQTAQEIMFAGLADRKRRCFPVIPAVKTLIKREWEKQDQRGFLPSASKRKYPFSDEELLTWTKVPKVDAAVASTSKQSTLPVEDAGLLVDPLDRKAESSLKRSWEAATGIFKPAVASTCAARSMIIWIDQLDQQIEKKSSREKLRAAIPLIRGAAAFLADASADSLRLAARSAGLVNNARRALWMKSWKGDAQSKSKICAIPCEGEPLKGGRLAKGGKRIGLQHGPLKTTSREVPCLEDPTPQKTNTEDIPVGGRLKFFTTQWEKITSSSWVLNIVRDGIKLKFSRVPHESYIITTLSSPIQQQALELEIQTLISKRVLVQVPVGQEGRGFYSPLFLISKPDGSFRTIINLKKLNSFIENYTFKMESIRSTIKLLFPNCMMGGIDLKDAYYHLPIHNRYQKFLRVAVKINNEVRHFQYAALPFGLSTAPRIFTKIMLEDLGWIINTDKSRLTPLSRQAFLGFQLDSISQKCLLPQVKILLIRHKVLAAINNPRISLRQAMSLLGSLISCIPAVRWAQHHTRVLQHQILQEDRRLFGHLNTKITLSQEVLTSLEWWLDSNHLLSGVPWVITPSHTITTDAMEKCEGEMKIAKRLQTLNFYLQVLALEEVALMLQLRKAQHN